MVITPRRLTLIISQQQSFLSDRRHVTLPLTLVLLLLLTSVATALQAQGLTATPPEVVPSPIADRFTALDDYSLQAPQRRRRNATVIHAYPVVGITFSQIEGDELKGFEKIGFTAGVGAQVNLDRDRLFAASIEATFSQRGAQHRGADPYYLRGLTLNYVDIPLMIHFTDPIGGLTIGAGLGYSRLVQQPHGEMGYKDTYFIPDTSDMSFLRNDLSIIGDIRFTLWRGLKLNFRYQYSLIPVKKSWGFTEYTSASHAETWTNDCYNSSISVRLLYVFGDESKSRNHAHGNKRRR